jgi:hypothetical protein
MPVTNMGTARDSILALFHLTWDAITPTVPPVIHEDRKQDIPEDASSYAEVFVSIFDGFQATLGGIGSRRFESIGLVEVRVRTKYGGGLVESDRLVQFAVDAFEGNRTADGVWFRNVRPIKVGQDGDWFRVDVLADMTYDRVK